MIHRVTADRGCCNIFLYGNEFFPPCFAMIGNKREKLIFNHSQDVIWIAPYIYVPAFTFPNSSELLSELTVESWEYEKIWYSNKLSKLQLRYVCKYMIAYLVIIWKSQEYYSIYLTYLICAYIMYCSYKNDISAYNNKVSFNFIESQCNIQKSKTTNRVHERLRWRKRKKTQPELIKTRTGAKTVPHRRNSHGLRTIKLSATRLYK